MTPDEYDDILYDHRILRWSARILGSLEAGFLLSLAYDQLIKSVIEKGLPALIPAINGQYFLAITLTMAFIGLILAYWKEGTGGFISMSAFIVLFIGWRDFHISFIVGMTLAAVPGLLYFLYRLFVYRAVRKANRDPS
ncbi:MAG TPA: hypothetical protein PKG48_04635 [Bacteroidales bacterium]|nr:hypothetical protein [Bacteroidales bacterium]HPS62270.1 hypothetical protein [Bacteroidales bacterium]